MSLDAAHAGLAAARVRLEAMRKLDTPPDKCRRHGSRHRNRCKECIDSYINGVAWYLVHPEAMP